MDNIRNIYCIGRNYRLHAEELGNPVPTSPFFFSKPTHSLVAADGGEVLLPGNQGAVHYEVELVVRIARAYEKGLKVEELVDSMTLGIDFTLRDVQSELKKKGHPWLYAKGFPNAAPIGKFIPFPGVDKCQMVDLSLQKNGMTVQQGNIKDMLFDLPTIIEFAALHFGVGAGDIIFTGTPAGVGPIADGDQLAMLWGEELLGEFTVKLGK